MEDQLQGKLDNLTKAILDESQSVTEKILEEVRQKRDEASEASEAALEAEITLYKKTKLADTKNRESRRLTVATVENRRELLKLRDEYSRKVFELLREKLASFTETPAYEEKLRQYLSRGLHDMGEKVPMTVLLRKADAKYSDTLKKYAEGFEIDFEEGSFEIGGLMISCASKHISIDMTYDTELRDLGGHFAEMFGLELE